MSTEECTAMRVSFLFVIVSVVVCAVGPTSARAQESGSDVTQTVARLRSLHAEQSKRPFAATIRTSVVVDVLDNASRFDLVKPQRIVHEASGVYHRDPQDGARMRIVATRGTAPLAGIGRGPIENFRTLADVVAINDDEIILLNTSLPSPLGANADRYYAFSDGGFSTYGSIPVQEIAVRATTRLRPAFDGMLYVARDGGHLVAMRLTPSERTAIPLLTSLTIVQTYSEVERGVVLPDSLDVRGTGVVRIAAMGLAEIHTAFSIASALDGHRIDATMPDSLRRQSETIVVRDDASDVPASYWASRSSLAAENVSAIESSRAAYVAPSRAFGVTFGGMIDYNRAGGATPTLSGGATLGPVTASASGGYSFGLRRPVGDGSLALTLGDASAFMATVRGGAFSQIAPTTTGDRSYPRIMNTLVAATLHSDYYNFFRKDGWYSGAELSYGKLRLGATYEQSRQFSIGNTSKWALLTWASRDFQPNPPITEGPYSTVQIDLAFARTAPFLKLTPIGDDDLRGSITGLRGARSDVDTTFELIEALLSYSFPILRTGYNPMTLTLLGAAGVGSATLPPQYQFRLRTSAATFGKPGGFVSPPKGLYGGTEYVAVGAELNLTDLPWRAIGLPTINGRGIEIIVAGATGRYDQRHWYGYDGTGGQWYSELGVGLSRIPLFITDIVYGRVDVRQGFGPIGRFGGNFTFVLPI
jgi:hypothetical protein